MSQSFDSIIGTAPGGHDVGLIALGNDTLQIGLTNYGARMLSIEAPDRDGRRDHVLLGFDRADMVLKAGSFGATLGRYANRIAGGRFTLDGTVHQLSINDGGNTLHGGKAAFAKKFWTLADRTATSAVFTLESPDGDQGFPGAMSVQATYTLLDDALRLHLSATTDKTTPVNLSAHPYFNLGGADALDICDHDLQVFAARYLPTDATQIPTGELASVEGTPFDFRAPVTLGARIRDPDPQLMVARGYDHCLIVDGTPGTMRPAARVTHPLSGRVLELDTDMAGLQVYTGNSLNGSLIGHGGTYRMTAGPRAGSAGLSGCAEPAEFSLDDPASRREVQRHDPLSFLRRLSAEHDERQSQSGAAPSRRALDVRRPHHRQDRDRPMAELVVLDFFRGLADGCAVSPSRYGRSRRRDRRGRRPHRLGARRSDPRRVPMAARPRRRRADVRNHRLVLIPAASRG